MQGVLGFAEQAAGVPGTIKAKQQVGAGIVDLAIGHFGPDASRVLAPLELKGPRSPLDAIMAGRYKTPVQQAWEYANDAPGAAWVLVSNMRELRLYAVGHGRAAYESFDLRRLAEADGLRRLQLFLHAGQLLGGATADLLRRSASEDRDITNLLYADYRRLRDDLLQFVQDQHGHIPAETRITLVQKLLDRLVFVAFAEDSVLVPDDSIERAVRFQNPYDPQPKWRQVVRLFEAVDKGIPESLGIPAYNGGLFAADPALEALDLPDHLVLRFLDISKYDFKSEVSVSILGHIFEQSITDIEALQAQARGEPPPKVGTRKRFGVVYTPEFVTRFIVERTIGTHLTEIAAALLAEHADGVSDDGIVRWKSRGSEVAYWRAYLDRLTALRIVDPACGSGAFLIAAFDFLHAEQKRVREHLSEIDGGGILAWSDPNADAEIITRNLYGVDVNAESVEITKLSLWLKTAKKGRPLESLDLNIVRGNSLIEDSDPEDRRRPFVWKDDFATIFAEGGFDIVIGNPPYVRMELLKPIKPYLEKRYAVVSDRADLYAYFFELGLRVLKPGGRLGYISSSTFFRTGSGAPLRTHLGQAAEIEAVVDFGDLQLFEGVTTYPAILTMRKVGGPPGGSPLSFLNVKVLPADLGRSFDESAETMPRGRLSTAGWRFEGDRLDAIRAKMAEGRKVLAEVYGAPLYGIKTGLNEAFVLSRTTRDALIAADAKSADLLKPFLIGENLKRWHVESDDLWLIYTPKNRVLIDEYPAIRDHLAPFKERLEARATKQEWWELQQAQAAYEPKFLLPKIVFERFQTRPTFALDEEGRLVNNALWCVVGADDGLLGLLNSNAFLFFIKATTTPLSGGFYQIQSHQIEGFPLPSGIEAIGALSAKAGDQTTRLADLSRSVIHRLSDIASIIRGIGAFRAWPDLDFAALRALIVKRCKTDILLGERDDWERWYEGKRAEAVALRAAIADAEAEINDRVYRLFDLKPDQIALIDESLRGQY